MKHLAVLTGVIALAAGPALAQTSAPEPPPLEAFGSLPAIEAVALSPDGDRVALVRRGEGERYLIDANLATGERKFNKLGPAKVRNLMWIDDEHVLFIVSATRKLAGLSRRKKDEAFQATIVNTRTGASKVMFGTMPEFYSVITSQPRIVTAEGKAYVHAENVRLTPQELWGQFNNPVYVLRTDPETGKSAIVDDGGGDLDRRESLVYDWIYRPDGQMVARAAIYAPGNRWGLEVLADGKWRRIMTREYGFGATRPNSAPTLLGLGRDGNSVLIWDAIPEDRETSNPEPRAHHYEVSLTGEVSEPLDPLWGGYEAIFHPATWRLAGFSFRKPGEDEESTVFYDDGMKAVYASARKAFPDRTISIISSAQDPRLIIVAAEGPKDPGSYYFLDLKSGGFKPIGERYPDLPDGWIAEQKAITYKAADGLEIEAYLTLPPYREPRNLPLIVLPHGGPQVRDHAGFDWWAQALASRGYAVLQPNYRGSDGYGRDFIEKGHGEWGRKMQTDLSDGVRELVRQGLADAGRVCITGGSYGGYAALAGATIDREPYRCAASVNGVADLKALEDYTIQSRTQYSAAVRYWRVFFGDRDRWDEVSPYRQAAKAQIPVLLIHGRDDTVVPVRHSQLMHDALKKAGKTVEYVELSGEDHWLSSEETRIRMLKVLVDFLATHNPP